MIPRVPTLLTFALLASTTLAGCTIPDPADYEDDMHAWADAWERWEDERAERERQRHSDEPEPTGDGSSYTWKQGDRADDTATDDRTADPAEDTDNPDAPHGGTHHRYSDADARYSNHLDGEEDSLRTIPLEAGTQRLKVKLAYDIDGEVTFRLRDPTHRTVALEDFDGTKTFREDGWYVIDDPIPGDWRLDIQVDGHGSYAVGFYHA